MLRAELENLEGNAPDNTGFGTSADGASLVLITATDREIGPGAGGPGENIHFSNAAAITGADVHFV